MRTYSPEHVLRVDVILLNRVETHALPCRACGAVAPALLMRELSSRVALRPVAIAVNLLLVRAAAGTLLRIGATDATFVLQSKALSNGTGLTGNGRSLVFLRSSAS